VGCGPFLIGDDPEFRRRQSQSVAGAKTRYRLYRLTGWSAPMACWHAVVRRHD